MKIGYMRWSIPEHNLPIQTDVLVNFECEKIYQDEVIGSKSERPDFDEMMKFVGKGDCIVVWRLDRIVRSLHHLITLMEVLRNKGVGLKSFVEKIDTTSRSGMLPDHFFGLMSFVEANIAYERTVLGLEAARPRGRQGGRKEKLTGDQITLLLLMAEDKSKYSVQDICRRFKISKPTYYRYVNKKESDEKPKKPTLIIEKSEEEKRYKLAISDELMKLLTAINSKQDVILDVVTQKIEKSEKSTWTGVLVDCDNDELLECRLFDDFKPDNGKQKDEPIISLLDLFDPDHKKKT